MQAIEIACAPFLRFDVRSVRSVTRKLLGWLALRSALRCAAKPPYPLCASRRSWSAPRRIKGWHAEQQPGCWKSDTYQRAVGVEDIKREGREDSYCDYAVASLANPSNAVSGISARPIATHRLCDMSATWINYASIFNVFSGDKRMLFPLLNAIARRLPFALGF